MTKIRVAEGTVSVIADSPASIHDVAKVVENLWAATQQCKCKKSSAVVHPFSPRSS